MSIDVMNKVVQRAPVAGSEFTCMLLMANWCDDEGASLYPSIALLAEGMRVSRSQAQRVLHRLMPKTDEDETAGNWWFRVVGNQKGGSPGMTRRYEMNVARLDALAKLPEFEKADERRRKKCETGRMGATGRMDATPRVAPMRPDSSEELSSNEDIDKRERASGRGCRLPDDFAPDLEWAVAQGMPPIDASREADRFRDHWTAAPGQRGVKRDWNATWRNWVRNALDRRQPQRRLVGTQREPDGLFAICENVRSTSSAGGGDVIEQR